MARTNTYKKGAVTLKLDYYAMRRMLKSKEMDVAIYNKAKSISDALTADTVAEVIKPENPKRNNRSRYYVVFSYSNPQEKNKLTSKAMRAARG